MSAPRSSHPQTHRLGAHFPRRWLVLRPAVFGGLVSILVLAEAAPTPVCAVLHTGVVDLFSGQGWDFSDSLIAGGPPADIVFDVTVLNSQNSRRSSLVERLFAMTPAAILFIGNADSTYENLTSAPTDPDLYLTEEAVFEDDVHVVRTREGHYAKIRILPIGSTLMFEYTYQDDGSPSFVPNVAVRSTTWGKIKALYRH